MSRSHLRTYSAAFIPALIVWLIWLLNMYQRDLWHLFSEAWHISLTMIAGSLIAGATSEGGGAVAFPVLTLLFKVRPSVARDFSLMIQSVGMSAAGVSIFLTRIPVERRSLIWSSLGGALGIIFGCEVLDPIVSPRAVKMTFLSVWLAFSVALYWINRARDREVFAEIQGWAPRHAVVMFCTGVIGGAISGLTGSGLDILTFSLLVLGFRISEKVATPTSVILMGINALIGALWKGALAPLLDMDQLGLSPEAWRYWWVCVPVVVIGAPLGAQLIRARSRLFIAALLYVSIVTQFIAGVLIIPQTLSLSLYALSVFLIALLLFGWMNKSGLRRLSSEASSLTKRTD